MASAAAVVASQASKENPSMRTLMRSKTFQVLWGPFDDEPNIADLRPKIPPRGQILMDENMEMRLNGVINTR